MKTEKEENGRVLLTSFSGPDDCNVMPLTISDRNVSWELEEDRRILGIILEQVNVDTRVDSLKQHTPVGRVELGTVVRIKKDPINREQLMLIQFLIS